jgi:MFS family permease
MNQKRLTNLAGWLVFAISAVVYFLSAERTGSLWDCGEFIAGAYKLQVVHPPGAPLFLLIGRMFTYVAEIVSNDPADIAFAVNFMSGLCSAFAAMFIARITMMLGQLVLVGREGEMDQGQAIATAGAGIVAGLSTAFATSVWFSAVEGEVYAMSTFFTTLTLWAAIKWYSLPDERSADRWLIFSLFAAGLSIGIHLLSILTFPALAMFYYFKRYKKQSLLGTLAAAGAGMGIILLVQVFIIIGIPKLWSKLELMSVNGLGLPFHSGLIFTLLIVAAIFVVGIRLAHQRNNHVLEMFVVGAMMVSIGFSTIGIVVIRANAEPPINMNNPSDAMRLLPYLNREQYGERPLFYGPWYGASPSETTTEDRYGKVGDRYEVVDQKISYEYRNSDMMLFPRMGDNTQNRAALYEMWRNGKQGKPSLGENISFFLRYQIGWMYGRYFMWNFAGRQNGTQGYFPWDPKDGHWYSGISFLDEARLYDESYIPSYIEENKARNKYYMLPFLFGILGLLFHFKNRSSDALGLLALFVITGIGIIVYSNQPPNEPRERDYVLVGSFFTYAIWIGMGVLALFDTLRQRANLSGVVSGGVATALVLIAPLLMGFQNFDDHSRRYNSGARDYAVNFLESCEENAIIFTYGDNDTYPLWYAQEVEGIRTDVRVVNLSLIAVDWYIDGLRRKVNDSPPIKLTIDAEAYRGNKRNATPYYNPRQSENYDPSVDPELDLLEVLRFIGQDQVKNPSRRQPLSYLPTRRFYIDIDPQKSMAMGVKPPQDSTQQMVNRIPIRLGRNKSYLIKDELAILDVVASNINERPIYFAVTCRPEKLFGMQNFMQLEGLSLRIVPVKTPQNDLRKQYGQVYGAGRVATDALYENVMNEFKWGNFDKYDLFVDHSYGPSIQSLNLAMLRGAEDLLRQGDNERAIALSEKYFEVFPEMNFPLDYRSTRFINILVAAGACEKAYPHMEEIADNALEGLIFYESLSNEDLENGFRDDFVMTMRTKDELLRAVRQCNDAELIKKYEDMFAPFDLNNMQGGMPGN